MRSIARALWGARALGAVALFAPALALLVVGSPLGWPALVAVGLVQLAAGLTLHRYLSAVQRGDTGEILLSTGARVPASVIAQHHLAERIEHVVGGIVAMAAVIVGLPDPLVVGGAAIAGLVQVLLLATRFALWRQHRAYLLVHRGEPARALPLLRALAGAAGPLGTAATHLQAAALLRLGDLGAARRLLASRWTGDHDATGALLAVRHLAEGDRSLAEAWLSTPHPDDRYHRYLRAMVAGHLAVVDDAPQRVLSVTERAVQELPELQAHELRWLRAAATRRLDPSAPLPAGLDPVADAWRAAAHPHVWRVLHDAAPPPVRAPVAGPPGDAYAPPSEPLAPPRRRASNVGAVPYEACALGPADTRFPTLQRALTVLLVGLALTLAALGGLLQAAGQLDPGLGVVSGAVIGLVAFVLVAHLARELVRRRMAGSGEGLRLEDGRLLPFDAPWLAWAWVTSPALVLSALCLLPLLEFAVRRQVVSLLLIAPVGALVVLAMRRRITSLRSAVAVHTAPIDRVVAQVEALPGAEQPGWLLLAHLVAGRVDRAQQVVDEHAGLVPQVSELGLWLRAARGEASLQHLLGRDPSDLGDRFRHAVALRLAALQAGQAERILDRIDDGVVLADQLPNRFGGLLHQLNLAVLRAAHPAGVVAYEHAHVDGLARGRWVPHAWVGRPPEQ
jgi:hypothetical protein